MLQVLTNEKTDKKYTYQKTGLNRTQNLTEGNHF